MSGQTARERLERALADHGCTGRGSSWQCPGPKHENGDRRPSLSIGNRRDGTGVIVNCHRSCPTEDILEPLGMTEADLFDEPRQKQKSRVVAEYVYTDETGRELFRKVRYDPKGFSQYRKVNGQRVNRLGDVRRVLYRLPEVIAAVRDGRTVFVVEGEKDADRLASMGLTATCNYDGADETGAKWHPEYGDTLRGADVVIIADRDPDGFGHARAAAADLERKAKSVAVRQAAVDRPKADVSDHLNAGYQLGDLVDVDLSQETADSPDGPDSGLAAIAAQYVPVDWETAWKGRQDEVDWLIPPFIEAGTVNALYAVPGTGKSLIALEWALRTVRKGRAVVYIDEENRLHEDVVPRLRDMGATPDELGKLIFYSFASLPPLDTPAGGMHLLALAVTSAAELVVIDTASRMISGGENDSDTWLKLYQCSIKPLKGRGIAVLRIDHPGKDAERGQRGSSAKNGDVDTVWRLSQVEHGKPFYRMNREKSRSGHGDEDVVMIERKFGPLRHVWETKAVRDSSGQPPEKTRVQVVAEALDNAGIPSSAGRDRCRTAVDSMNIQASNALLTDVVKYRKTRPDSSGQLPVKPDRSAPQSQGAELSAAPPPPMGGAGGQVDPDQSAETGGWPEGSIGEARNVA